MRIADDDDARAYARRACEDPQLRSKWAADADTWSAILDRLKVRPVLATLKLTGNVSACSEAAAMAAKCGVTAALLNLENLTTEEEQQRWTCLANLTTGDDASLSIIAPALNSLKLPENIDFSKNVRFVAVLAVFTTNCAKQLSAAFCLDILKTILKTEESDHSELGNRLVRSLMVNGKLTGLHLAKLNDFECLGLVEHLEQIIPNFENGSEDVAQILLAVLLKVLPKLHPRLGNRKGDEAELLMWETTCKALQLAAETLPQAPTALNEFRQQLLPVLYEFLKETDKLPKSTKLATASEKLEPSELPLLRVRSLTLLAVLAHGSFEAQELARKSGALATVLSSCHIDANNPFMKEAAILCIRYLLANNQENQNFVAQLEAKGSANAKELAEAGWELEVLSDGKIVPKKAEKLENEK